MPHARQTTLGRVTAGWSRQGDRRRRRRGAGSRAGSPRACCPGARSQRAPQRPRRRHGWPGRWRRVPRPPRRRGHRAYRAARSCWTAWSRRRASRTAVTRNWLCEAAATLRWNSSSPLLNSSVCPVTCPSRHISAAASMARSSAWCRAGSGEAARLGFLGAAELEEHVDLIEIRGQEEPFPAPRPEHPLVVGDVEPAALLSPDTPGGAEEDLDRLTHDVVRLVPSCAASSFSVGIRSPGCSRDRTISSRICSATSS